MYSYRFLVSSQIRAESITDRLRVSLRRPLMDDDGMLHWRVAFLYPETMQQDIVEDVHEAELLSSHLDVVRGARRPKQPFRPDAPVRLVLR